MADQTVETRFAVHEAICAERYGKIDGRLEEGDKRMMKIEYLLYLIILVQLFGPGVAADFVKKLLGI